MNYWTTKEKVNIPIEDIPDYHLNNIIKLLQRQNRTDHPAFKNLKKELDKRNGIVNNKPISPFLSDERYYKWLSGDRKKKLKL